MATVLYVALADLEVRSFIDDWPCPVGSIVPLDPSRVSTARLLAEGKIMVAPDGSSDTTTPAHTLRGVPGLRVGVSN